MRCWLAGLILALSLVASALADETQDRILSAISGFHAGDHDMHLGAATMHDRFAEGLGGVYVRFFVGGESADNVDEADLAARCGRSSAIIEASRDGFSLRQTVTENEWTRSFTTLFTNKAGRFYTYRFDIDEEAAYYGLPADEPKQRMIARGNASGLAFAVRASPDVLVIRSENGIADLWLRCGAAGAGEQVKLASESQFGGLDPQFAWYGDHARKQQTIAGTYARLGTLTSPDDAPDAGLLADACNRSPVEVTATSFAVSMKDNYKGRSMTARFALRPDGLYTMFADPDETLGYGNPAYKDLDKMDAYIGESLRYIGGTAYLAHPTPDVILAETPLLPPGILVRCPAG